MTKIATPKESAPANRSRASGYAASTPKATEITVDATLTIRLFANQLQNSVSVDKSR